MYILSASLLFFAVEAARQHDRHRRQRLKVWAHCFSEFFFDFPSLLDVHRRRSQVAAQAVS